MVVKKLLLVFVLSAGVAIAQPVSFTGTVSTDLADEDNWEGGALPTAEDVAVVDFSKLNGATEITNSTDQAFAGLVLTNLPGTVTLWGTNTTASTPTTLTLGADGWRIHHTPETATKTDTKLYLNLNLATAAEQTWSFVDEYYIYFNGTISGTAPLTITSDYYLIHNVAPGYGGKIRYTYKNKTYHYVRLCRKGAWANDVEVTSGRMEFVFTDTATWQEIFPGRKVQQGATLLLTQPKEPQITFEDGDSYQGGDFVVDKGRFTQTGGAVTSSVQVGYSEYTSLYEMRGGALKTSQLVIGNAARTDWTTNQEFRLIGGEVFADRVELGWRARGNVMSHVDLSVREGSLTIADSTAVDGGFHLGSNRKNTGESRNAGSVSGGYRQTGGTVKTPQVSLGAYVGTNIEEWIPPTNCWVTLAMDGGLLDVGARGFNAVVDRWNARPEGDTTTQVNSRYRISFKSGTLAAYKPFTSELDFIIPVNTNTTPFVVDTRANDVTFAAPIWGAGNLEKKGAGTLTLVDASRYTGRLAVKEGTLKLMGAASTDDTVDGERCFVWRAEDAVKGLEEGAEIETWPDATGTRTAVYDDVVSKKNGVVNGDPVTKPMVELNAFNGHAGVKFNQSALKIAKADNPIAGSTNWTVCVVLKTDSPGLGSSPSWYLARGVVGREEGGVPNDWALVFDANGHFGGGLGIKHGSSDTALYTSAANYADGQPHVVFYSLDCNGVRTITVDGEVKSNTVTLDPSNKSPRTAIDMYLGVHNIADGGPKKFAFIGSVAEFRFYPDKALTASERAGLGAALAAKYGASNAVGATGGAGTQKGELVQTAVDAPMPDDGAAAWDADSLDSLGDGAAVASWTAQDGNRVANLETGCLQMTSGQDLTTTVKTGIQAPTLVKGAFNGHHGVRFSGYQALGIPAADSPVSGKTAWSVAMVFRTTETNHPGASAQFYLGRGLFGAELPSNTRADWGVTFWANQGRVLAGYGGKGTGQGDNNLLSRAWDLNDGEPHVLVATFDTTTGAVTILVDGVGVRQNGNKCTVETPRDAMRVLIGSINTDCFFRGDIAAFRLYDHALTLEESDALLAYWNDRYAIPPSPKNSHAAFESGRLGLGAKEIAVDADATLVLPVARTAPFALQAGQRLTVSGAVKGTLGVGAGGVLDLTANPAAELDGLWLQDGGVVKASFNQTAPIALSSFRAEGTPVIELTDRPAQVPATFTLFTYAGDASLAEGLAWTVTGASRASTVVVEDGKVMVRTAVGTLLIVR